MRTGIAHLSDETLGKLLHSFESKETSEVKAKSKLVGLYSYDILTNQEKAW